MKANDVDLIQRTLDGDQGAFTTLVNKYQKSVHALAWRKIGDFHSAEEITQDVFLKVYERLSTLKRREHFPGWLYVITTRHCLTWLRKKQLPTKSLDTMSTAELEEICYAQYEADRGAETAIEYQRELVKRLLQKLPESERTVVILYYLSEMTGEEISLFLGVSHNTIRSRLRRARERLEKEENIIQEVLNNFQISTNLIENITREIARIRPASPTLSKPWIPWGLSFASTFLVILMLGFGTRALSRFQQPYSWTRGDLKWHDTDMQDAPVFESFYATNGFQIAVSGKVVYLGKSDGSLFQSLDGGNTWTDVTENFPLPLNKAVSHTQLLENLPHFKEIVFVGNTVCVSTNDGVAISDDGENWHVLTDSKNTPIAMHHLAVDGTILYGVSETGAYQFKESTRTWIQIASEIPKRITSLVVAGNVLYVGTEHRGVLRLSLHEL